MQISESKVHFVTLDDGSAEFVRFGASSWFKFYGDSLEPVFHDYDLEALFQDTLGQSKQ